MARMTKNSMKPMIIVNQYYQQAQKGGGQSFFRRFDDPKVTGYGWMSPGKLLDDSTYTAGFNDVAACPVVPKPPQDAITKISARRHLRLLPKIGEQIPVYLQLRVHRTPTEIIRQRPLLCDRRLRPPVLFQ